MRPEAIGGFAANIAIKSSEHSQRSNEVGSRAAVLRRSELTCFSSASDDEVGGDQARSALSERSERSNQTTYQE
jgi:hypothetical protein